VSAQAMVMWGGLALGVVFGVLAQATAFCLTGGLREWWSKGQMRRIGGFALALAVAILATQILAVAGLVEPARSLYLQASFSWLLVPLGGVLFGYGMMLARGCGARALVLLGEGNLRSLVVLLCLGIAAHAAMGGVLAPVRVAVAEATTISFGTPPGLAEWLGSVGLAETLARLIPALLLGGLLILIALRIADFHRARAELIAVAAIGLVIAGGWFLTGHLAADDFDPVPLQSLSFVAPVGDAIQYLMLATGMRVDFGVAVVAGVLAGAFLAALLRGRLELRGFEKPGQLVRAMLGGVLMGVGGVLALGCSIGQGLSGLSTLALSSFLAAAGILLGARLTVHGPIKLAD